MYKLFGSRLSVFVYFCLCRVVLCPHTCTCVNKTKTKVCVPEYERHRHVDGRVAPNVGDYMEIGSPRPSLSGGATGAKQLYRMTLRVTKSTSIANTTNPYRYKLLGTVPVVDVGEPSVSAPVRITTFLSSVSVHHLAFTDPAGSEQQRNHERSAGTGEGLVRKTMSYKARIGIQNVSALVQEVTNAMQDQLNNTPGILRFELERSGRGWHKHTHGQRLQIPSIEERRQRQDSHYPKPEALYGYGPCAQAVPDLNGKDQVLPSCMNTLLLLAVAI